MPVRTVPISPPHGRRLRRRWPPRQPRLPAVAPARQRAVHALAAQRARWLPGWPPTVANDRRCPRRQRCRPQAGLPSLQSALCLPRRQCPVPGPGRTPTPSSATAVAAAAGWRHCGCRRAHVAGCPDALPPSTGDHRVAGFWPVVPPTAPKPPPCFGCRRLVRAAGHFLRRRRVHSFRVWVPTGPGPAGAMLPWPARPRRCARIRQSRLRRPCGC